MVFHNGQILLLLFYFLSRTITTPHQDIRSRFSRMQVVVHAKVQLKIAGVIIFKYDY